MSAKASGPKIDPRMQGFMLMGLFIVFQIILLLLLKFVIAPDHAPSLADFIEAIRSKLVLKAMVLVSVAVILAQQFMRSRLLKLNDVQLFQFGTLLVLAEVPGLVGFVGAIIGHGNVSFALPLIILSIVSFMTLKPVVLKLKI